jgi:hypothetical protein
MEQSEGGGGVSTKASVDNQRFYGGKVTYGSEAVDFSPWLLAIVAGGIALALVVAIIVALKK